MYRIIRISSIRLYKEIITNQILTIIYIICNLKVLSKTFTKQRKIQIITQFNITNILLNNLRNLYNVTLTGHTKLIKMIQTTNKDKIRLQTGSFTIGIKMKKLKNFMKTFSLVFKSVVKGSRLLQVTNFNNKMVLSMTFSA